ncbi:hypothetical protein SAMN05421858_3765 [Haladaptatus litoreus]|uniref:Uncharacterized protein n=1 Tax=Haladaptatus litoreus TaxID=553468 RepID=A0A1N7DMV9_9EURY|nr:hypothetical protein SAMN05421858_3765 [Haladaptatus litoreus]
MRFQTHPWQRRGGLHTAGSRRMKGGRGWHRTRLSCVNYSVLPRSGLPAPRLLRTELPVSVSERAETISTASTRTPFSCGPSEPLVLRTVPDSAGDFPLQAVRSVPLLPDGHSATTSSARHLSRLNTGRIAVSVLLHRPDESSKALAYSESNRRQRVYPLPTHFVR